MKRLFDIREGEARGSVIGFTVLLLLVIAAHTVLETARDALLLTGPGPRALGLVYMLIAAATVPCAAVAVRVGNRFGQRRALGAVLFLAVLAPLTLFAVPAGNATAITTYVVSGVLGSIVVPQFWMVVGSVLTVSQGRRLFGLISAGGIVGGILGPAVASATLVFLPVRTLLVVSSVLFVAAVIALALVRATERADSRVHSVPIAASLRAFREHSFLSRVALVVFLSTATFFALDYRFKSAVASALPRAQVGPFVAHYYLALNVLSLVVQLLTTGTFLPRVGMLPALALTPLLLLVGGVVAFVAGAGLFGALLVKSIDGSLRYSIHRVTDELAYLPVPASARLRTKPFIDGTLARAAQTATGAVLFALGGTSHFGPRAQAAVVVGLASAWLATVLTMRRPYLALLRKAVTAGSLDASAGPEPIDLDAAQLLVQRLASADPLEVEGAMVVLARRGRVGLVPALVLLHRDEGVLVRALELLGESSRSDWFELARQLLNDSRESVRVAAARALARHDRLDASVLVNDVGWRARGYAAVRMALRDPSSDVVTHPAIAPLLAQTGEAGVSADLGMLAAAADSDPTTRLWPLLRRLAEKAPGPVERTDLFARAAARQRDPQVIPCLVSLLEVREGRESVRAALVALGEPAQRKVWQTLRDPARSRRLRLHMPKTLARFATKWAAEHLLQTIETERDGLIRYKAIRALRLLVTEQRIVVDRSRVERLCRLDMGKHFLSLALLSLAPPPRASAPAVTTLLEVLLREKAAEALERAFQLLQIAYPRQGVHHAYLACQSDDSNTRANAVELLDTLLRRRGGLGALFHLAVDDLPIDDRVVKARALVPGLPDTAEQAARAILDDDDPMLTAIGRRVLVSSPPVRGEPRPLGIGG